jgi:hypothetical protein
MHATPHISMVHPASSFNSNPKVFVATTKLLAIAVKLFALKQSCRVARTTLQKAATQAHLLRLLQQD